MHATRMQRLVVPQRAAVVVRASGGQLEGWQVSKLQQALATGRRQVKVEKLCKELGMERQDVLQWLKNAPPPPPVDRTQQSLLEAQQAAVQAAAERQAILQQPQTVRQQGGGPGSKGAPKRYTSAPGPGGGYGPGGTPAWKHFHKKKALGRQAEATLEMIFTRTQWPSDEAVSSLWDLHRLPREKALDWFKQRRKQEADLLKSRNSGSASSGSGSSCGSGSGAGSKRAEGAAPDAKQEDGGTTISLGGSDWVDDWERQL